MAITAQAQAGGSAEDTGDCCVVGLGAVSVKKVKVELSSLGIGSTA